MEAFLEEFQHLRIQLKEIKSATGIFDEDNVIGKGGFGKVYKGILSHSRGQGIVAFKRLDRYYGQGDLEFWKEIMILSRYTHENLISLLGFCDEDGEKILVYEHASHGSLDHHLGTSTLTWKQRLKICLAAARGLRYLHDPKETQIRVLHRDIKSSNILLDENWNAKVSDMGMSKIGPANQHHTLLVSNATGTLGYVDPLYMETSILTKESDIYSFGVVLFETLCGRLCFEYNNLHFQSLVPKWKKSYKENKLEDVIFQNIKEHMDQRSLEIFKEIAYRCLKKSRKKRPTIYQVVENLENARWLQEISEVVEQPIYYQEMSKTIPLIVYRSKEELKMLLSNGILVNGGKTWFWLNKKGEHCEMISAAECFIPTVSASPVYKYDGPVKSRFVVDHHTQFYWEFKTHVRAQFLSPHVTYRVNLVFDFNYTSMEYLGFNYILRGDTKSWTSYVVNKREDGWLMAELFVFTCERRNIDLEITFDCHCPLTIEGIEFQPLERVEHELFEDDDVDMQTISDSDTYWEQKLPSNYEDILKLSTHTVQCTTKKELYFILRKGFLINDGKEWFSLAKNGMCHMLSARVAFHKSEWSWLSLPRSRFIEVAFRPRGSFWIYCRSNMLSRQTTYATYLVYRLRKNQSEPLVKVSGGVFLGGPYSYENNYSWYIYLLCPQTPIIRGKYYENTHNPWKREKMKGLPQQRNDGWMEVQLWEFRTGTRDAKVWANLRLTLYGNMPRKGLIVQGIVFKPI
ncbi:unnamed protein product [Lactuca virosa]|uniref:non-specific serine/threonine protein kinase n=1 Tax=Lactuca virosa TaxID=75947 RepID=A0AAU9PXR0_9ASTR|nr:unnamed protein product [Lactuca virosa]